MKILLWAPLGSGYHYWGPGISAFNLYSTRSEKDFSLYLAHGYKNQAKHDLFDEQFFISALDGNKRIPLLRYLIKSKYWIKKNAYKFDVVHVLGDHIRSYLPALWFAKAGVPVFVKPVGADGGLALTTNPARLIGWKKYKLNKVNSVSGYVSISSRISIDLHKIDVSPEKIHFIPNGVDTKRFHPIADSLKKILRKELGLYDRFTVLFTGTIDGRKNPSIIVNAFRSFKNNPTIQLVIVGPVRDNGLEKNKIMKIIEAEKLDNVHLVSYTNEIEKYYKASDVFVLPSSNEGLSNSLLEAQACGLPAIVTKISGSEDMIVDGVNGRFIETDSDDIFKKINYYFSNSQILSEQSQNAVAMIKEEYDSEVILNKHLSLFKRHCGIHSSNDTIKH
jgi:glycosyltransferase involved in cell wall biosynthesis